VRKALEAMPTAHVTAAPSAATPDPIVARYSNTSVGGADPQTPVFAASVGDPVRFRLGFGGGSPVFNAVFNVHGHNWQENPWVNGSTEIGNNVEAQHFGMEQVVPNQSSNIVIAHAGGPMKVPGDYLYETFEKSTSWGTWGLMRVQPLTINTSANTTLGAISPTTTVMGSITLGSASSGTGSLMLTVQAWSGGQPYCSTTVSVAPGQSPKWNCTNKPGTPALPVGAKVLVTSSSGGSASTIVGSGIAPSDQ